MTEIIVIMSPENFNNTEIKKVSEKYCPSDNFYVMQEGYPHLLEVMKRLEQVVREKNEWKEKYENVLAGLYYWKQKALDLGWYNGPWPKIEPPLSHQEKDGTISG